MQTVDQLEAKLNGYCSDLPIVSQDCINLVDKYVPKIFAYLKQNGDKATATVSAIDGL